MRIAAGLRQLIGRKSRLRLRLLRLLRPSAHRAAISRPTTHAILGTLFIIPHSTVLPGVPVQAFLWPECASLASPPITGVRCTGWTHKATADPSASLCKSSG